MKTKLIITAHDFGLTSSVNEGIIYALNHKNNIFSEISLLPNAPASEEAAQIAKNLDISVDLCICLTNYKPISKNLKTMVDAEGWFLKAETLAWDFSCIDKYSEEEIRREIDAQWDWFVKKVGKKPSGLVSQKGEHGDPKILLPFIEKAKKENVPVRTPVWKWKENYAAQSYANEENVLHTKAVFIGLFDWKGRYGYDLETRIDQLISDIKKTGDYSELLLFCGFVDEELMNLTSINWQRGQFLSILDNDTIIGKIKDSFELISFKDLK